MYERSYGELYDGSLTTVQIAAKIRAEVKRRVKAGELPADWKYSIRSDSFAGGSAIRINATSPRPVYLASWGPLHVPSWATEFPIIVELPIKGEWKSCAVRQHGWHVTREDVEVPEAKSVREQLEALHAAYNHNGSDIMTDYFDVNYYGTVELETFGGWQARYERDLNADLAAAAREAQS